MSKTEWPTESRLKDLRLQGLVGVSPLAISCIIFMGIVCVVILLLDSNDFFKNYLSGRLLQVTQLSELSQFIDTIWSWIVLPPLVCILVKFTAGLLQTKFLFTTQRFGFNLEHCWQWGNLRPQKIFKSLISAGIFLCITCVATLLLWFFIANNTLGLFVIEPHSLTMALGKALRHLLPILVVITLVIAMSGLAWSKLAFRFSHRMSRKEIEQEDRE